MPNRNIIIFNSLLLPYSQTFIREPAEKLNRFTPYYVGSRRVQGLDLPSGRTWVVNRGNVLGKVEEQIFKISGLAPRLYRQIQQLNPVLIHAQFGLSGALILPWARSLQIPLVVHYRGADATVRAEYARYASLNHWVYFQRREALKQQVRLFLTVSKFIKEQLIAQGFPAHKILPHYHGVDVDYYRPEPDVPREPIILFVGRLTEKKGCEYCIEATAQLQSHLPDIQFVCIGDGPLRSRLENLAHKQLRHYQFLGVQPPDVVRAWMNRARLLAAPSLTSSQGDAEGLPNVVLEAHAMALPVLSTLHAGIPEAVVHGKTGFLAPERNVVQLVRYGLQLFMNPDLWQHLSRSARAHVETHFNRAKQTRVLETFYEAVVQGSL